MQVYECNVFIECLIGPTVVPVHTFSLTFDREIEREIITFLKYCL
jgi:hypothetical protein